jgi:uncharacterized oligopeptide transporter (OPT) family protein
VSSRIVGLIGSSSNPISGMTIATLLGTCLIFVVAGWADDPSQQAAAQAAALSVGAIVCIAAANAGATSQDLKTGYIVGATPIHQQVGLVIGVLVSVAVIGLVGIGLAGLLVTRNLIKVVVGLQVIVKGGMLAMVLAGRLSGQLQTGAALALTVIVADTIVSVVALAFAVQVRRQFGTLDIGALSTLRR